MAGALASWDTDHHRGLLDEATFLDYGTQFR